MLFTCQLFSQTADGFLLPRTFADACCTRAVDVPHFPLAYTRIPFRNGFSQRQFIAFCFLNKYAVLFCQFTKQRTNAGHILCRFPG